MSKTQLIIDTDPGVDDALAIMSAFLAPKINLLALTTVYGNSTIQHTTENALTISQILNADVPVFQGASMPIYGDSRLAKSHGDNGLGGFKLPTLNQQKQQQNAIDYLIQTLDKNNPKTISIAVIGPATNLAILKSLRPDLFYKIKELIVMAGVFNQPGNVSPVAEFNAYNDPTALDSILNTEVKTVLIPADICRQVVFSKNELASTLPEIQAITSNYIDYYLNDEEFGGFTGGVMYDVLTIAFLVNPELFKLSPCGVFVQTQKDATFAQTIKTKIKQNPTYLVTDVDVQDVKNWFLGLIFKI